MKTDKKTIITGIVILVAGILLGWIFFGGNDNSEEAKSHELADQDQVWTCSMHPQIRKSEPGQCPICGMDLIPLSEEESSLDPNIFRMSENAMKLANVRAMKVGEGAAQKEIRMNGKVELNESNSYTQSTHIPGRIEQLRVNFTGEKVNRGQVLAVVYSPAIVTAQEELLQAAEIKESQPELFEAAKQKLRNWKISDAQINNMLKKGTPVERFPITADVSGVVTKLMAEQGDYLERGMPIYQIADLDKVWILFDLYENELNWVKEGSTVNYSVASIPGKTFEGKISFIDPLLNDNTRVATARVEVNNKNMNLKPGTFVSGVVETKVDENAAKELTVPKSAVLWTGERSVVYVRKELDGGSGFELREVNLGPELGDSYVIKSGLEPGDEIVVNGTFSVDAAVQLAGKPSMMNPDINNDQKSALSESDKKALMPVFMDYLKIKDALVNDDFESAKSGLQKMSGSVENLKAKNLSAAISEIWKQRQPNFSEIIQALEKSKDIKQLRDDFDKLSNALIGLARSANPMPGMYVLHCPMANNNTGADWLSMSSEIKNPYYGSAMISCGEVKSTLK